MREYFFVYSNILGYAVVTSFVFPFGGNREPEGSREEQHGWYDDHTILTYSRKAYKIVEKKSRQMHEQNKMYPDYM